MVDGPKELLVFLQIDFKQDDILFLPHKLIQFGFFEVVEEFYVLVTTLNDGLDS